MKSRSLLLGVAVLLSATAVSLGQLAPSPTAKPQEAATQPTPGDQSGTNPGSSGSSGWSGGTGGSYIGTAPNAPTSASKTAQPETATGLDPIKPK